MEYVFDQDALAQLERSVSNVLTEVLPEDGVYTREDVIRATSRASKLSAVSIAQGISQILGRGGGRGYVPLAEAVPSARAPRAPLADPYRTLRLQFK